MHEFEFIEASCGFPDGASGEQCACQCMKHETLVPPWLEGYPGEGNGNLLQYSRPVNPTDRGAWWATAHRVAKSRTQLKQLSIGASCGPDSSGSGAVVS